jgi:ribonuclease P protein component
MRSGKKLSTKHLVGYLTTDPEFPTRFGFVVSKACGNAVKRNQLKRRLRAIARDKTSQLPAGSQVVVRTLPGSSEVEFSELVSDFDRVLGL